MADYTDYNSEIGSNQDVVSLWVGGKRLLRCTKYTVASSIMTQPSSFTLSLGSGDLARDLLHEVLPNQPFELKIGNTVAMSGRLEDPSFGGSAATEITIAGRSWLSALMKETIQHDQQLTAKTYMQLTRQVLDLCKLQSHALAGDNDAARRKMTRSANVSAAPAFEMTNQLTLSTNPRTNSKVVLNQPIAKVAQDWFSFLKAQYKGIGLYLWNAPDGSFVLARPTARQVPLYSLVRYRGAQRNQSNVITITGGNKTSGRHAHILVVNRSGKGETKGLHAVTGTCTDFEMVAYGFDDTLTIYDQDCKTLNQCEYRAFRQIAEERRANCALSVTVSGHTTPSLLDAGKMVMWAPDTVVQLRDEETGIDANFYIEEVVYSRQPHTTTTLKLMSMADLAYLGETNENEIPTSIDASGRAMQAADTRVAIERSKLYSS